MLDQIIVTTFVAVFSCTNIRIHKQAKNGVVLITQYLLVNLRCIYTMVCSHTYHVATKSKQIRLIREYSPHQNVIGMISTSLHQL